MPGGVLLTGTGCRDGAEERPEAVRNLLLALHDLTFVDRRPRGVTPGTSHGATRCPPRSTPGTRVTCSTRRRAAAWTRKGRPPPNDIGHRAGGAVLVQPLGGCPGLGSARYDTKTRLAVLEPAIGGALEERRHVQGRPAPDGDMVPRPVHGTAAPDPCRSEERTLASTGSAPPGATLEVSPPSARPCRPPRATRDHA